MTKNKTRLFSLTQIFAVIFWLIVWFVTSRIINQELILSSPLAVLRKIGEYIKEADFWKTVLYSFTRISAGFLLAILLGTVLAVLTYRYEIVKILLNPLITVIKSVTVASLIILFLVWFQPERLSIIISIFMAFPIIYTNVLKGLQEVDKNLLEMAKIFRITTLKKIVYIYVSQVMPYFESAGTSALGLAWKAGIAAEVIGLPKGSIGESLYESKIYLNTENLFSWTIAIIILGYISEKIFLYIIRYCIAKIMGDAYEY